MTAIIDQQKQDTRKRLEWYLRDVPAHGERRISLNYLVHGVYPPFEPTEDERREAAWMDRYHPDWQVAQAWHDRVAMARVA